MVGIVKIVFFVTVTCPCSSTRDEKCHVSYVKRPSIIY